MTTPERIRRRQHRDSLFIALIGMGVLVSSLYFHAADTDQRECFADNFADLTTSLNARGVLAGRDAEATDLEGRATRLESRANNRFYRKAFAATSDADVLAAYGNYKVKLAKVQTMRDRVDAARAEIAEDRERNPIPDFPTGTCS